MFVQLLMHEVTVLALPNSRRVELRQFRLPFRRCAIAAEDLRACAVQHRPVAIFKVCDAAGQWRQCQCIRSDKHFAVAEAHRQWCAFTDHDNQIGMAGKNDRQRISSFQPSKGCRGGTDRVTPLLQMQIDELGNCLRIGLAGKCSGPPL